VVELVVVSACVVVMGVVSGSVELVVVLACVVEVVSGSVELVVVSGSVELVVVLACVVEVVSGSVELVVVSGSVELVVVLACVVEVVSGSVELVVVSAGDVDVLVAVNANAKVDDFFSFLKRARKTGCWNRCPRVRQGAKRIDDHGGVFVEGDEII